MRDEKVPPPKGHISRGFMVGWHHYTECPTRERTFVPGITAEGVQYSLTVIATNKS